MLPVVQLRYQHEPAQPTIHALAHRPATVSETGLGDSLYKCPANQVNPDAAGIGTGASVYGSYGYNERGVTPFAIIPNLGLGGWRAGGAPARPCSVFMVVPFHRRYNRRGQSPGKASLR